MISKKHPIEILEGALKYEKDQLVQAQLNIKTLKDQAAKEEGQLMPKIALITGLEDALHKLKGLDNLEKKNKIADNAEMTEEKFLRKGPTRTPLKWKHVEDMEIRRFIKDYLLPEITQLLRDRQYTFHEQLKEALK